MRAVPLALAGLLLTTVPAPAARFQDRGPAPHPSKVAPSGTGAAAHPGVVRKAGGAAARHRPVAAPRGAGPMRVGFVVSHDRRAAVASSAPAACPRGGREGGAFRCRAQAVGWMHGLSPAAGVQASGCPAGTTATLATGHADVVRCVPT